MSIETNHSRFDEAFEDLVARDKNTSNSPDNKILYTPIGQALMEHFAQYGDIFKERAEL
jgi:hypothetical protein